MASPNPINIVPDILLMILMLCGVRLWRTFAAKTTFKISARILTPKHTLKITNLSAVVFDAAKAVALMSQKSITLGLSVLMRKPDINALVKAFLPNWTRITFLSSPKYTFLKKR